MTAEQAFKRLADGNARHTSDAPQQIVITPELRAKLVNGQYPFAAVVACSDSRVPVELIFDTLPGDLFVVRTAGNVVGPLEIGSIEFAVTAFKTPLVLVLGHQNCGAVIAATKNAEFSEDIQAILQEVRSCADGVIGSNSDLIEDENIRHTLSKIAANPNISKAVSQGAVRLAAAKYSLETGVVSFFD